MPWTPPDPNSQPQAATTEPLVYWGPKPSPGTPFKVTPGQPDSTPSGYNWETQKDQGPVKAPAQDNWDSQNFLSGGPAPVSAVISYPLQLLNNDKGAYKALTDKMLKLGLLKPGFQLQDVQQVWNAAVQNAASLGPTSMVSPQAALDLMAQGGGAAKAGGGVATTRVMDATTAESYINAAYQQAAGRNATKAEQAKFLAYINKQEAANASTTTQTGGGNQTVTSGLNETQVAQDYAQQNAPDANWYAGQQFLRAFQSMPTGG